MSEIAKLSAEEWIEQLPYPSLLVAADSRVLHASRSVFERFAMTAAECVGREALSFVDAEKRGALQRDLARWFEGDVYAVRVESVCAGRAEDFVALPARVTFGDRPAIHVVLVSSSLLPADRRSPAPGYAAAHLRSHPAAAGVGGDAVSSEADRTLARLTPREAEIARRIASGDRVGLICVDLGISVNTVRNHLKSIFRKLRIRSQSELVRKFRSSAPPDSSTSS